MFTTYKSSAGSGKTTHLVADWLVLCFKNTSSFKNILSITFTNNSTAEMKNRILNTLYQFAFCPPADLSNSNSVIYNIVKNKLNFSDDQMVNQAHALLSDILYDYSSFSVSTIDSFFQRLIHSFAFDLQLNVNSKIEIQLDDCYAQTLDIMFHRLGLAESKDLSKRILQIVENTIFDTGNWNIDKILLKTLKSIYSEDAHTPLLQLSKIKPDIINEQYIDIKSKLYTCKSSIIDLAEKANNLIKSTNISEKEFVQGNRGIYKWFSKVQENPSLDTGKSYILTCISKGSFTKNIELPQETHDYLVNAFNQICDLQEPFKLLSIYCQNFNSFIVLFDLKLIMDEIKQRDNLFYLSEANGKIYDEIKDEETPYIYEKLGNRYSHFFIDEFQDTSKMQWDNLLPLLSNALSSKDNRGENGSITLFGDVKQAIYRFRNGDAQLFNNLTELSNINTTFPQLPDDQYSKINLQCNYRSAKNIVDFNNQFFEFLVKIPTPEQSFFPEGEKYYEEVKQSISSSTNGFVNIRFKPKKSSEDSIIESTNDYLYQSTLWAIKDALSRNYSYKDITILTRGNETGSNLANFLSNNEIPVISSESLLISSSSEVNIIINSLFYIHNSNDNLIKLQLLQNLISLSSDNIDLSQAIEWLNDSTLSFTELLLQHFNISIDIDELRKLPLYTLVTQLFTLYQLTATDAYTIALLDVVNDFCTQKYADLNRFLQYWNDKRSSLSITIPNNINAVLITTIHKSKGLEYPIVILPINQLPDSLSKNQVWYECKNNECNLPYLLLNISKSMESTPLKDYYIKEKELSKIDSLNLLYVAQTRAKEALYIITNQQEKGNYAKYLDAFIQHSKTFTEEPNDLFWFGDKDFKTSTKALTPNSNTFKKLYFSNFTNTSQELYYSNSSEKSKEQAMGLFIHDYLSKIINLPTNDEELTALMSTVDEEYADKLKAVLQQLMNDEEIRTYYNTDTIGLNEQPILSKDGTVRRPDRIVLLQDKTIVIDYKTGKANEQYNKQINEYCDLLREMGYPHVEGKIIYF